MKDKISQQMYSEEIDYELSKSIADYLFTLNKIRRVKKVSEGMVQAEIFSYCHKNNKEISEELIDDVFFILKKKMKDNTLYHKDSKIWVE